MKNTKRVSIAAIASIAMVATATIGTTAAHSADTVNMTMVGGAYTDQMQPYFDDLTARFAVANPGYTMKVNEVSWNVIDDKVKTLIATGQTPDIVNKNDYAAPAAEGLLYKATEIVSPKTLADIIPAFMNNSKYNGVAYAVPDLASARAFFYNKAIFAKAGIKKAPLSWADVKADALLIQKKVPGVYGLGLPLGPEEAQAEFTIWTGGNGARLFTNGKWTINSAKSIEAFKWLKSLVDLKLTQPNPAKTDRAVSWSLFAKGKVAMVNGSVFMPQWLKDNGGGSIPLGITPFPTKTGKNPITLGVQDYFTGYKANGNQVGIQKFLDFLFIPANYAGFLKAAGGFIPATVSAGKAMAGDKNLAAFIKLLPNAIFYPGDQAAWPAVKNNLQNTVGTALIGNISNVKKVLDGLQKKAEAAAKKS